MTDMTCPFPQVCFFVPGASDIVMGAYPIETGNNEEVHGDLMMLRCHRHILCAFILTLVLSLPAHAQNGLYEMREMDMHLHAGMERPVPMQEWVDFAIADGRKIAILLDHLELYRKTPEEYSAWREERGFNAEYPVGKEGHAALMADIEAQMKRDDIHLFKGWEVYEGELDTGTEIDALRRADVIGWHISPNNGSEPPNGQTLIKRARQIKELQKELPIPMILFHPFSPRFENLRKTAEKEGRSRTSLTAEDFRYFQAGEQEELAEILKGTSIYVEISRANEKNWEDPATRQALMEAVKPLAELGVQFTVSTDAHGVSSATKPFHPEVYAVPCGLAKENTNGLARELLAARQTEQ